MDDLINILVVDDEQGIRDMLSHELSDYGYHVLVAEDGLEAVNKVRSNAPNLVICDHKMPKMEGVDTLKAIKEINPEIEVIMMTGYGTIDTAVAAMKLGAFDFIQKPFSLDEILDLVKKALEKNELKEIIGVYEASKAVFSSIRKENLLPLVTRIALKVLKADGLSILLRGDDNKLHLEALYPNEVPSMREALLGFGAALDNAGADRGEPLVINKPSEDPRFSSVAGLNGVKTSIVQRLETEGNQLGFLIALRTLSDVPFSASCVRTVTIFGSQVSQAILNAKIFEQLEAKVRELDESYRKLETAQKSLIQAEKLTAVGQLAAGVAHELNNPLTGILGFAQMLLEGSNLTHEQMEDIESICQEAQRCKGIIQDLLRFCRRSESEKAEVDLTELVEGTFKLVKHDLVNSQIEVEKVFPQEAIVIGDGAQLQQVFLNLITNSKQAMDGRPVRKIVTRIHKETDKVILEFSDTGSGMPTEVMDKIFDPFFTTKPPGLGTGLGLSVSQGIIQDHGGSISVESQNGSGTTVKIELPRNHEFANG